MICCLDDMQPRRRRDAARGLPLATLTPASVVVWGGGNRCGWGHAARYDIAFSTARMSQLLDTSRLISPAGRGGIVVRFTGGTGRAGTGRRSTRRTERATAAALVAANTNGRPRAYGTVRDWVTGSPSPPIGKVARAGAGGEERRGLRLMKLHIGARARWGWWPSQLKCKPFPSTATVLGHFGRRRRGRRGLRSPARTWLGRRDRARPQGALGMRPHRDGAGRWR